MKQQPRLLIFEPRRLGDAFLSLPLVRSALPVFDVYVCCPPASESIYRTLLPTGQVILGIPPWELGSGRGWLSREFHELVRQLNSCQFTCIVSVWPDPRVHLWMNLVTAPIRIGFPINRRNYYGWEQPWRKRHLYLGQAVQSFLSLCLRRPLLSRALLRSNGEQSHLECWRQIAECLELNWLVQTPWFAAPTLAKESPAAAFVERARTANKTIWLIHLGAHATVRRWPLYRFSALLELSFKSDQVAVLIINAPSEPALETGSPWHFNYSPPQLSDLFGLTALVDRVLCHDSMMAHLAAALGKKVYTLFGPQNPNWFAPWANEDRVIIEDVCPHRPCFDRCVFPSPICMESITVQRVARAIQGELFVPSTIKVDSAQ